MDLVGNREASLREYGSDAVTDYIEVFESKSPYFQYDYIQNRFIFNRLREIGRKFVRGQQEDFAVIAKEPELLVHMFQHVFPAAIIHMPVTREEQAMEYVLELQERFNNGEVTDEQFQVEIDYLNALTNSQYSKNRAKKGHAQPNRVLHKYGLHLDQPNHKKKAVGSCGAKIIPYSPIASV